jgi:hypothetical protein
MKYRYHTGRGLRIKGQPFDRFDGMELKSEDYESYEDFIQDCVSKELELIYDQEEADE